MTLGKSRTVAVIGAGIAGAACAHALQLAGHAVHVIDKSRGVGGRLATRRLEWIDPQGVSCTTRFDHGAIGISAHTKPFKNFVDRAVFEKRLALWKPALAPTSFPLENGGYLYVPVPDMPSLCRQLLEQASVTLRFAVDRLNRNPLGWQLEAAGECHPLSFDAVVLALPPAQAATLLNPHHGDWAAQASAVDMQPCWTLMGIANAPESGLEWELARPSTGPLAWVMRNDARPGRELAYGQVHWVVHARADWSRQHLEQPAAWIQQQMRTALEDWLGGTVDWQQCVVHRWRYALPPAVGSMASAACWWDASLGLGVCGDFFGEIAVEGIEGVERAWLSAHSLSATLLDCLENTSTGSTPSAVHDTDPNLVK